MSVRAIRGYKRVTVLAGLAGCLAPVRRATRIEPVVVMRGD